MGVQDSGLDSFRLPSVIGTYLIALSQLQLHNGKQVTIQTVKYMHALTLRDNNTITCKSNTNILMDTFNKYM